MNKLQKLRLCDWSLLVLLVLTLASGIQLEIAGSKGSVPVIMHIVVASIFMGFCFYHVELHFQWSRWLTKFRKLRSAVTKVLWWVFLFTLLTGIATFIHWIRTYDHSPLGGVHGKIGFLRARQVFLAGEL